MKREILLIDDDEDELEVFNLALSSIDKTIECAHAKDLEQALEYLDGRSPNYIFIDFNMPRSNGLECLAEIKHTPAFEKSRVILYSNHIDEEMREKAMSAGAFTCIKKPNMINVLAKRLKEILNS